MEDENKQRRNYISLSELNRVPWNSASGGFAYNWQSKCVGIITIKTERTQIHFLSDVLVAVASLDLKVPIGAASQTLLNKGKVTSATQAGPRASRAFFLFLPASLRHKGASAEERESLGRNIPVKTFLSTSHRGIFSVWITPGRWGNPLRLGNPPVHIISHFNLITFIC